MMISASSASSLLPRGRFRVVGSPCAWCGRTFAIRYPGCLPAGTQTNTCPFATSSGGLGARIAARARHNSSGRTSFEKADRNRDLRLSRPRGDPIMQTACGLIGLQLHGLCGLGQEIFPRDPGPSLHVLRSQILTYRSAVFTIYDSFGPISTRNREMTQVFASKGRKLRSSGENREFSENCVPEYEPAREQNARGPDTCVRLRPLR